jgi:hypothetical protein
MRKLLPILMLLIPALATAQPALEPLPDPGPPPSIGVEDEMEPEVRIIKRDDAMVEEYRMNGALYMVKVTPVVGPAYYLIDTTGDGDLNARRSELDPAFVVPSWMIFRW